MTYFFNHKLSKEEKFNQITHMPGILLGFLFLIALLVKGFGDNPLHLFGQMIYALTYIVVFGASTIYHSQICPEKKDLFKRIDHASIYLFMAGCYTPFVLINMKEDIKYPFLALVWGMALFGILYKFYSQYKARLFSTVLYLAFGYMCFMAQDGLLNQIPTLSYKLLVYGGILYSVGAIFYMLKMIPYGHGIWHLFVIGGSSLHFLAVYLTY